MERIIIIGKPGSGKSTLALKLGKKFNLPVVHLDKLYWLKGWVEKDKALFRKELEEELKKDKWIIDGNFNKTLEKRLEYCDTVIYLDYPALLCILSVLKRVIKNLGRTRNDMADDCPEKFDIEFLKYIWDFDKKLKNKYYNILASAKDKKVLIFKNRKETAEKLGI